MKRLLLLFLCMLAVSAHAQTVTRTQHRTAMTQDAVTTGSVTIRKPDYISISTDGGREQLIMEGTKFTMTMGGKQHVTDSRKNAQFATFHAVLKAVINNQPVPTGDDLDVTTKNGQTTITITPAKKETAAVLFVCAHHRLQDLCHQAATTERARWQLHQLRFQ